MKFNKNFGDKFKQNFGSKFNDSDIDFVAVKEFLFDKKVLSALLVIVMVCSAAGFYFLYWVKRPEYSIGMAHKAVATHNTALFERYVDLDTIYGRAFDDILEQAGGKDIDVFTMSIASGLVKDQKESIVSRMKEDTLAAVAGTQTDFPDEKSMGVYRRGASMVCQNMTDVSPVMVYRGAQVVKKAEGYCDVKLLFADRGNNGKSFPVEMRMDRTSDGRWRFARVLNIRQMYRNLEYVFDDSAEKLKEQEEMLARIEEERRREAQAMVKPEAERMKASRQIWKFLPMRADYVYHDGDEVIYRFIGDSASRDKKSSLSLSVYNDVIINKKTNGLRKIAALVVSGEKSDPSKFDLFDKIYFSSIKKALLVDVKSWEAKDIGFKSKLTNSNTKDDRISIVFFTPTNGLEDAYSMVYEDGMFISFYMGEKHLASFETNDKLRRAVRNAMYVNDIIKKNLNTGYGGYSIVPLAEDDKLEDVELPGIPDPVAKKNDKAAGAKDKAKEPDKPDDAAGKKDDSTVAQDKEAVKESSAGTAGTAGEKDEDKAEGKGEVKPGAGTAKPEN